MNKRKIRIKKERPVKMYQELYCASSILRDKSKKQLKKRVFYEYMASLLFSAFTFEAYLNHLGDKRFKKDWHDLEKLHWLEKLIVIENNIGLKIDKSRRPFQTIKNLFNFRNSIAHGKSEFLTETKIKINEFDIYREELPKTKWEKYCTLENAERAKTDVKKMITKLHKKAGYDEDTLFHSGISTMSGTMLNDE